MTLILPQRLMDPTAILSKSMRFIHETGQQTVNHLENIPFYPQIELPLVILMTLHRQVRHTKYKLKKDFLHQFRPLILFSAVPPDAAKLNVSSRFYVREKSSDSYRHAALSYEI